MQVTAAKELGQSQAEINHCLNDITGIRTTAVVSFSNLFEVDSTNLGLNVVSDSPKVVRINVKQNAKRIRKSASRPRLDKRLVSLIIV